MKIFETRNELLEILNEGLIIAELGVFKGEFSKILYEKLKPSKLFLVDIFNGIFGSGDKDGKNYQHTNLDEEYIRLVEQYKSDDSVIIYKDNTVNFLTSLEDNYLDVVYIDADHSYNSVLNDLMLSYNKVKIGGYIMGHDYVINTEAYNAVNYFIKIKNIEISYLTNDGCPSFCIIK